MILVYFYDIQAANLVLHYLITQWNHFAKTIGIVKARTQVQTPVAHSQTVIILIGSAPNSKMPFPAFVVLIASIVPTRCTENVMHEASPSEL